MHRGLSFCEVIDISIDVQNYIRKAIKSKLHGMPIADNGFNSSMFEIESIREVERFAGDEIESFESNWYRLIDSISSNKNHSTQERIFILEGIANNASKLLLT